MILYVLYAPIKQPASIAPVLLIGGKLLSGIGSLLIGLGRFISLIKMVIPIVSTVLGVIGTSGAVFLGVAGAIIALGVLIYKNWDKIKAGAQALAQKVGAKWTEMKTKVATTAENIRKSASEKFDAAKKKVGDAVTNIKSSVSEKFNSAKTTVARVFRMPSPTATV